jgi:uncharacterized membrane protein YphA (DoxX/SURF4 family)
MGLFRRREDELLPLTLRLAASATFLWFGADKWSHPEVWYGWMPSSLLPYLGDLDTSIYILGVLQFVVGVCLATNRYVRSAALVGFFMLMIVSFLAGFTEVGVRDVSLMGLCLATAVYADQQASKRLPTGWLGMTVGIYMFYMFLFGVMYLRAEPIGV